ncbi:hypothetical protein [Helicobacter sp. T3_23-1056]
MAWCNFCKKLRVRSTDFIFMIIMCVILYFVYKWQFEKISQERAKKLQTQQSQQKSQAIDSAQDAQTKAQLLQIMQFLQSACDRGDKQACEQLQKHKSTQNATKNPMQNP